MSQPSSQHDPAVLTAMMRQSTPLVDTLAIDVVECVERVRLRLPNLEACRNHVGGPHAGAIFTLGETTAAALMLVRVGHLLDRAKPLAVRADIAWSKLARCAVIAEATSDLDPIAIAEELSAGGRPEWTTTVRFVREDDGAECGEMSVLLTLVQLRPIA